MAFNKQTVYSSDEFITQRKQMVEVQLKKRGILNPLVLAAMLEIPRHLFLEETYWNHAYDDCPLPIGGSQTISQPYMVAKAAELLSLSQTDRVLEIGAGSGYQAVVLSKLCQEVVGVENKEELVKKSRANLIALGVNNVNIVLGDGKMGWPTGAPYDRVLVSCASDEAFESWQVQLKPNGILIFPKNEERAQIFCRYTKGEMDWKTKEGLFEVRFVPLQ
ncbi:MAG: protein-L-isoaspartate(D-aspartate) O-methyltransferase [Deltaproteobacteria bacterium]|nr:protein-L-isoaspartate(D-aspartate) O-methyltransferase [Deltaproteobacteria bacterium]